MLLHHPVIVSLILWLENYGSVIKPQQGDGEYIILVQWLHGQGLCIWEAELMMIGTQFHQRTRECYYKSWSCSRFVLIYSCHVIFKSWYWHTTRSDHRQTLYILIQPHPLSNHLHNTQKFSRRLIFLWTIKQLTFPNVAAIQFHFLHLRTAVQVHLYTGHAHKHPKYHAY